MQFSKAVASTAFAAIFVVSAVIVLFNTAKVINVALETYVFEIDDCDYYRWHTKPLEDGYEVEEPPCGVNYNAAKRELVEGLSWLLVGLPVSIVMFRQTRQIIKT